MKKILILLAILLGGYLQAQDTLYIGSDPIVYGPTKTWVTNTVAASGVDSANWEAGYKTVYYSWTEALRPGIDTADFQNDMYYSLDTADILDSLDVLLVLANRDSVIAKTNWVNPGTNDALGQTNTGTLGFDQYEGFTSDGASYITSNYNPSTDGTYFKQNSASMGLYSRTSEAASATFDMGAAHGAGNKNYISLRYTADVFVGRVNENTGGTHNANSVTAGLGITTRTGSTTTSQYMNGADLGSANATSVAIAAADFYILCRNNLGTASGFSTKEISIVFFGGILGDTQASEANTIFETYMDAIGKGVQ